jgi:hypothetical protein
MQFNGAAQILKKVVTFLKKSNQKTFTTPRPFSGHSMATQTPGLAEVFCALFFKKALLPSQQSDSCKAAFRLCGGAKI